MSGNMFYSKLPSLIVISALGDTKSSNSTKRRIVDGTGEKELYKALGTFMNATGAGDYSLPPLTGTK